MGIWQNIIEDPADLAVALSGSYKFNETGSNKRLNSVNTSFAPLTPNTGNEVRTSGIIGHGFLSEGDTFPESRFLLIAGVDGGPNIYRFNPNSSFAFSLWVNPQALGDSDDAEQVIMGKYTGDISNFPYRLTLERDSNSGSPGNESDKWRFVWEIRDSIGLTKNTFTGRLDTGSNIFGHRYEITENTWYHIICGLDFDLPNRHAFMYVNNEASGAPSASNESDGELGGKIVHTFSKMDRSHKTDDSANFQVGSFSSDSVSAKPLTGIVDNLQLWHRIPTSGEIRALYNDGFGLELPFASQSGNIGGYLLALETTPFQRTNEAGVIVGSGGQLGGHLFSKGITVPSAVIGGHLFGKANAQSNRTAIVGGLLKGLPGESNNAGLGGFLWALPVNPNSAELGGWTEARFKNNAILGGYSFGRPSNTEFVDTRNRSLIKAVSDSVFEQTLDINSKVVFKAIEDTDFGASFQVFRQTFDEFAAQLKVEKFKDLPNVFIQSVSFDNGVPSGQVNNLESSGFRTVTVTASGTLGEGENWSRAQIDFGNPSFTTSSTSISGFKTAPPWTASHTYESSGIFTITAKGVDNRELAYMDSHKINLASGLVEGVDYPSISISGQPRVGFAPPALLVDFNIEFSGVGAITTDASSNIKWSFGTGEISNRLNPSGIEYISPGFFVPVARVKHQRPDGTFVFTSDSLLVGFNN